MGSIIKRMLVFFWYSPCSEFFFLWLSQDISSVILRCVVKLLFNKWVKPIKFNFCLTSTIRKRKFLKMLHASIRKINDYRYYFSNMKGITDRKFYFLSNWEEKANALILFFFHATWSKIAFVCASLICELKSHGLILRFNLYQTVHLRGQVNKLGDL